MKSRISWFIAVTLTAIFAVATIHTSAQAQGDAPPTRGVPHCTNGTASGTYGYQMKGQIVGVGPFLVNGIFTANSDGTSSADVQLVVGDKSFPAPGTGGTFKTNDDCTGSGKFRVAALNPDVTFNFIVTDDGRDIGALHAAFPAEVSWIVTIEMRQKCHRH